MKNKIIALFTATLIINFCQAQIHEIDSLKHKLSNTHADSAIIQLYLNLDNLYSTVNPDSSIYYGNLALEKSKNSGFKEGVYRAYILNGIAYYKLSQYAISDSLLNLGYKLAKETNDKYYMASAKMNAGLVYTNQARYLEALESYNIALLNYKELNDEVSVVATNVNIGIIYFYQGNLKDALRYHLNALKVIDTTGINNLRRSITIIQNIGAFYSKIGDVDSATIYTKRALNLHEKLGNIKGMAMCYNNLGEFEAEKENWNLALNYFQKSLEIKEKIKDLRGIMLTNNNIGSANIELKKYSKAIPYLEEAVKNAETTLDYRVLSNSYQLLSMVYDSLKNYKKAYQNYLNYHLYYDTVQQNATDKQLLNLQTKYETEQKEQQIKLLEKEKLFRDLKLKKNRLITILLISGVVLLAFFILFLYRSLRERRKINRLLRQKNNTLNTQKEEIENQRNKIVKQQTALLDSINYAKRIQEALLPLEVQFDLHLPQHFIFYQPKDIISGDFYWIKTTGNYIYFTVADCTGHGVPGALMSMLGISFLNEIIGNNSKLKPSEVLEELRKKVKNSLKQTGNREQNRDGMDIAFCRLDTTAQELLFAGANNPVYYIHNNELIEVPPTQNPIGIYIREEPFTDEKIKINTGDSLYLFSDGYIDQMGGEKGNRFLSTNFKKLLQDNNTQSIEQQYDLIANQFESWKKDYPQIDDVTVLGIRF